MEINFFGIGGAFNYKLGNNCAYIKQADKLLLIDVGLDTVLLSVSSTSIKLFTWLLATLIAIYTGSSTLIFFLVGELAKLAPLSISAS